MRKTLLDHWEFKCSAPAQDFHQPFLPRDEWRPALVPGHIHLDLIRNGVIADPFVGQAELGCQWVDAVGWTYRTTFHWQPSGFRHTVLRFEGLDSIGSVVLNGQTVYDFHGMFGGLEIPLTNVDNLQEGENQLRVEFKSAVEGGIQARRAYFDAEKLPWDAMFFDERAFVRKAQFMSGWDWGPRLVSCGLWKPVSLLEFDRRILSFDVFQEALPDGRYHVWSATAVQGDAALTTRFDGIDYEGDFDVTVEKPKLWWPNGYGEASLYLATASIEGDSVEKHVGLRTLHLLQNEDAFGRSFEFEVNGIKIWARGANWIPNDSFPSRITDHEYEQQVATCKRLNFNMLRVWGGGLYESDAFYEACDRAGILVWQDFPFACSYYPEDSSSCDAVAAEATEQIKRLRHHPALALWCGNNECLSMFEDAWGGIEHVPARYYGQKIYEELLPTILATHDPNRPYIPTSPLSDPLCRTSPRTRNPEVRSNAGGFGDQHYWDVWHGRGDWRHYADSQARFSSEFGFASSCSLAQWKDILRPEEWDYVSQTVRWHDKTGKPFDVWEAMVLQHYPKAMSLEDWVYTSQLNQRDALRYAIELYRRSEFCKGSLIWQFNDCWPVQSWAVQDYKRRLKPAAYELERLYAPQVLCFEQSENRLTIHGVNDGKEDWTSEMSIRAYSTRDGSERYRHEESFSLLAGSRRPLHKVDLTSFDPQATLFSARFDGAGQATRWMLLDDPKNCDLMKPEFECDFSDNLLGITVQGLAVDLVVYDPDNFENLMPDDSNGSRAVTLRNEMGSYRYRERPKRLIARSLWGTQEIKL